MNELIENIETKKTFNKKKLLMFGIPIALSLVLVLAVVWYQSTTVNLTISEALSQTEAHLELIGFSGETIQKTVTINNAANVNLCTQLTWIEDEEGNPLKLILENKDSSTWKIIDDGIQATLEFNTANPTFKGILTTTGLDTLTEYALIYYPDQEDRFASDKWNGAGGKVITTFTGDVTDLAIDTDLGMNLPNTGDWNINPDLDYCDLNNGFDDYAHCKGAKIWIVKTNDLTRGNLPLTIWNPTAWLFETDLITYTSAKINYTTNMPLTKLLVPGPTPVDLTWALTSDTPNGVLSGTVVFERIAIEDCE